MRVTITLSLSVDVVEKLNELKQRTGKSKSKIVEEAILKYYEELLSHT